jgi:hypothetical protein
MAEDDRKRVTEIVSALYQGTAFDGATAEELMPLVYDQLRRLARAYMSRETPGHTLQPTASTRGARDGGQFEDLRQVGPTFCDGARSCAGDRPRAAGRTTGATGSA